MWPVAEINAETVQLMTDIVELVAKLGLLCMAIILLIDRINGNNQPPQPPDVDEDMVMFRRSTHDRMRRKALTWKTKLERMRRAA